jgi:membrane protein DedA with SNARE-associated domain
MRLAALLTLTLLLPALPFLVLGEIPGARWLAELGDDELRLAAGGAVLLAADVLLPIPSSVIGALLGARLSVPSALAWTWSGLVAGNVIGYALGRWGLAWVRARLPADVTLVAVIVSRPVPVLAEAVVIAAGAARVPWAGFLAASMLANGVVAAAFVGYGAAVLPPHALDAELFGALAIPAIAWLAWRWWLRRSRGSAAQGPAA